MAILTVISPLLPTMRRWTCGAVNAQLIACDSQWPLQAPPEPVRRALTDFTDRRLQDWNRTLDPKTYEARELGLGGSA